MVVYDSLPKLILHQKKKKYSQFFLFPPKNIGNIFFLIFGKLKKKKNEPSGKMV